MQLLKLRYFQLKRDLGYWVLIIAGAAFYFCYQISSVSPLYGTGLVAIVLFFLYGYQLNRKDLSFVRHYLGRPKFQVLLNYNLLVLPLAAALLANQRWLQALALHAGCSVTSFLRPKGGSLKLAFISRLVPAAHFEWISGLRKNFYMIAVLLLPALILSPVKLFGLIAPFLLNSIFLNFYHFSEPLVMLNPQNLSPTDFLNRKTNYYTKMLLITNGPLLLVNSLFNPDSTWFNACFLFAFLLLGACSVYIKYANYKPNESQQFSIDFLILFASVLLPYLLPLAIILYYSNRRKAIHHLSFYAHDNG